MSTWITRPETTADLSTIREINLAAFPTAEEADLVDALRADPQAWIDGLSHVAETEGGDIVGHALLTRCHIDAHPALALAPCAVLPAYQRKGAGSAVIQAVLEAARARGENTVVVLGHPDYYPRFGFTPASRWGIRAPPGGAGRSDDGALPGPAAARALRHDPLSTGLRHLSPCGAAPPRSSEPRTGAQPPPRSSPASASSRELPTSALAPSLTTCPAGTHPRQYAEHHCGRRQEWSRCSGAGTGHDAGRSGGWRRRTRTLQSDLTR